MELNFWFNVMRINVMPSHRAKIVSGFTVIRHSVYWVTHKQKGQLADLFSRLVCHVTHDDDPHTTTMTEPKATMTEPALLARVRFSICVVGG